MYRNKKQLAEDVFFKNKGFARTRDLIGVGINYNNIKEWEAGGLLSKVKHGLYRWNDFDIQEDDELIEVSKIVPRGVICLLSALSYHELTTYNPWEYYIAVRRNDTVPRNVDYPPIKFIKFTDKYYESGIEEIDISGNKVKIYNKEKTLCDCIRFRNKIGIDVVKEGLKTYMSRPDKDINKLVNYSGKFRVKSILNNYLEVL